MEKTTRISVLPFESGRTYLDSGLVVFRESYDYFKKWRNFLLEDSATVEDNRGIEFGLTIKHESVHFIQGITTGLLPGYSLRVIKSAGAVLTALRNGQNLHEAKEQFTSSFCTLKREYNGISITDILEGVAVVESFKLSFQDASSARFAFVIERLFPVKETREQYTKTFRLLASKVGEVDSLAFLSPLSFIALNFDAPERAFHDLISTLTPEKVNKLRGKSAAELFSHLGLNPD